MLNMQAQRKRLHPRLFACIHHRLNPMTSKAHPLTHPPSLKAQWPLLLALCLISQPTTPQAQTRADSSPQTLNSLAAQCAPRVHYNTLRGIVKTESALNPFAIGVDDRAKARPARQPRNLEEAKQVMRDLDALNVSYSAGIGQIHISHIRRNALTPEQITDPCFNLTWLQRILTDCYSRAEAALVRQGIAASAQRDQRALDKALSCYNSGNFSTGLRNGYVDKVRKNAQKT